MHDDNHELFLRNDWTTKGVMKKLKNAIKNLLKITFHIKILDMYYLRGCVNFEMKVGGIFLKSTFHPIQLFSAKLICRFMDLPSPSYGTTLNRVLVVSVMLLINLLWIYLCSAIMWASRMWFPEKVNAHTI